MKWLQDSYTIQVGDAAAGFTGRGYNPFTGQWETLSQVNLAKSRQTRMRLRYFGVYVLNVTTFGLKEGLLCALYTVLDDARTDFMARLQGGCELQGAGKVIHWAGDYPMSCGCLSRINIGGVVAGDRLDSLVGYEDG
jgi:hypothetical protein